jgi:hypothetical protein
MKMEQTDCSETSVYTIQAPGNYPEESIQHSEHGENLKSRDSILVYDQGADADIMADSKCELHVKINYVMAEGSCSVQTMKEYGGRRSRVPLILKFDFRWKLQVFVPVTPGIH